MILSSRTTVRSLWNIISTNNMTPLCDHPVIHSALTNKHAAWRERRAGLSGNADLLDINSDALAQPAQLFLCGRVAGGKKNYRKYRSGHVTYLCIWETFVEILILFIQRMFCNGKKRSYTYGNSLKNGLGQQKIVFFFLFFQCLL